MTRAAIPDPPDEACRDRETVRLPRSTSHEIQELVDEGKYPNRSAVIRAGARLLIKCENEGVWPQFQRGRGSTAQQEATADDLDSLKEVAEQAAEQEAEQDADDELAAAAEEAASDSVDVEVEAVDSEAASTVADAAGSDDAYEFVTESAAVSESDIVTKLSSVMREATAGERQTIAS